MMRIRRMTTDDLPLGLRLTRQAGWNQTKSDWQRFVNMEPDGCFVAVGATPCGCPGRARGPAPTTGAGTTTTCIFDGVAWIAMVLVEKSVRGRGIGTALLKHALDYLKKQNVRTVRLDATPAGRPIYEKLGFVPEYELARFEGVVPALPHASPVSKATAEVFSGLIEFDHRMTGTNREKMFTRLFQEFPELVRVVRRGNHVEGYIAGRPGANATQVGPCIATAGAGPSLLSDSFRRCVGKRVFIDVPLDNVGAVRMAEAAQLTIQRCFTRMCMGERINDNVQAIWSSSGPEKG